MNVTRDIYTLHRYFVWANRLRNIFQKNIWGQGPPPTTDNQTLFMLWFTGPFMHFSYWFAALYVVIEAWKEELKLKDSKIDTLLDSEYCDILRRYRNGVFHYQKRYFNNKFTSLFDEGDEIGIWANEVHEEFSRYFLEWFKSQGTDYTIKKLDDGSTEIVIGV